MPERTITLNDGDDLESKRVVVEDWSAVPDETYMRSQLWDRFNTALDRLPPIYRTPIVLRDIQGLSTEEASAVLNVKSQTLKSRLHRGRLVLREQAAGAVVALVAMLAVTVADTQAIMALTGFAER